MICVKLAAGCQREVEQHTLQKQQHTDAKPIRAFPHNLHTVLDIYKNKLLRTPICIQHELWLTSRPWFAHFGLLLNAGED